MAAQFQQWMVEERIDELRNNIRAETRKLERLNIENKVIQHKCKVLEAEADHIRKEIAQLHAAVAVKAAELEGWAFAQVRAKDEIQLAQNAIEMMTAELNELLAQNPNTASS